MGRSYLNPLTPEGVVPFMANVTFEPGCRNNWHIHHAGKGGGQILLCVAGEGWYQEWGGRARSLKAGDERQALARSKEGQSVFAYRGRSSRRKRVERMA